MKVEIGVKTGFDEPMIINFGILKTSLPYTIVFLGIKSVSGLLKVIKPYKKFF